MNLKLESHRDVNILIAGGAIEPANFAVLKAGIKKLLKDGKNKIILELTDSSQIATEILRELAHLNLLASELAGQILLSGIAPLTRAKIESFSKPPVVRCFQTRELAFEFFHPKIEEAPAKITPEAAPKASVAPANPEVAQQYKSEIRAKELGDLGELRKRMNEVEHENKELSALLSKLVVTRRDPPDLDAWKEKVVRLEKELADAIAAAQTPPPKK